MGVFLKKILLCPELEDLPFVKTTLNLDPMVPIKTKT
jgi:hypothetical protein